MHKMYANIFSFASLNIIAASRGWGGFAGAGRIRCYRELWGCWSFYRCKGDAQPILHWRTWHGKRNGFFHVLDFGQLIKLGQLKHNNHLVTFKVTRWCHGVVNLSGYFSMDKTQKGFTGLEINRSEGQLRWSSLSIKLERWD